MTYITDEELIDKIMDEIKHQFDARLAEERRVLERIVPKFRCIRTDEQILRAHTRDPIIVRRA